LLSTSKAREIVSGYGASSSMYTERS
jgi:hypothetical protein